MCLNRRNHETLDFTPLWTVEKSWCILSVSFDARSCTSSSVAGASPLIEVIMCASFSASCSSLTFCAARLLASNITFRRASAFSALSLFSWPPSCMNWPNSPTVSRPDPSLSSASHAAFRIFSGSSLWPSSSSSRTIP